MPFATDMPITQFSTQVMGAIDLLYKQNREIIDLVSVDHPVRRHLKKKGRINQNGRPALFHTLPVTYSLDQTFVDLSRNSPIKQIPYAEVKGETVAYFEWQMIKQTLTISEWDYKMCTDKVAMMTTLQRRIKRAEQGMLEERTRRFWHGHGVDGIYVFGGKHFIRATPTADPAEGKIGGIGVADIPTWGNKILNGGKPLLTWSASGNGIIDTFLEGENGLDALYLDLIQVAKGDGQEDAIYGEPDLIPCNNKLFLAAKKLLRRGDICVNPNSKVDLGVTESLWFKGGQMFYDPDMPVVNAAHGECRLINSNSIEEPHVPVQDSSWTKAEQLQGQTAFAASRSDVWTLAIEQQRANGYAFGFTAAATEEEG